MPICRSSPTRRLSCASSSERAVPLQERVRVLAVPQGHRAVQRKRRLHGAQLHHPCRRGAGRPDHRGHLDRLRDDADATTGAFLVNRRPHVLANRAIASHDDVGAGHRPRFPLQAFAHALDDRAYGDDRRHADGNAYEEKEQPLPGRANLAQRHADDERHRTAPADAAPALRKASSGATGRPSRSVRRVSARDASSASCVTSTRVA